MSGNPILLVEDDPNDAALTERVLKRSRILNDVRVIGDGAAALEYLLPDPAKGAAEELPVLVLLDLKLPKVDGLEILCRIRSGERTKNLPVIVLTSSSYQEDLLRSYNLGVNSFIRKPIEVAEFFEAMRHLDVFWALSKPAGSPG